MALDQLGAFMNAISSQESSGNYDAVNPQSGATGRFQIMKGNWPSWAKEAGLGANAPMTPENQDRVAAFKFQQYYEAYGSWDAVAVAWFAGPSRAARYVAGDKSVLSLSDGNMTVGGYIAKMRQGMATGAGKEGWEATQVAAGTTPTTPEGVAAASEAVADDDDAEDRFADLFDSVSSAIAADHETPFDQDASGLAKWFSSMGTTGADQAGRFRADSAGIDPTLAGDTSSAPAVEAEPAAASGGEAFNPSGGWNAKTVGEWGAQVAPAFGLAISSHQRSPEKNQAVGGAPNSDHLWGGGLDFAGDKAAMDRFYAWAKDYIGPDQPFRFVDHEGDHVHVSFNRGGTAAAPVYGKAAA